MLTSRTHRTDRGRTKLQNGVNQLLIAQDAGLVQDRLPANVAGVDVERELVSDRPLVAGEALDKNAAEIIGVLVSEQQVQNANVSVDAASVERRPLFDRL